MPIRKRRSKNTRRKIGGALYDDNYYMLMFFANVRDDFEPTKEYLEKHNLPFEYSRSPSGGAAFRVNKKYIDHPMLQKDPEETRNTRHTVFMPYVCYGKVEQGGMEDHNSFPYLFTEWTPIKGVKRRTRRRTNVEETKNTKGSETDKHKRVRKRVRRRGS